ncbi:MAG: FAD:protein FMN transferase [Kiritimatiellae bacterium]|nr:FAD:protein FMN transferase [Kiritimatiellia bacterium]
MRSSHTGTILAILLLAASLIGCRPPPTRQADFPISSTPAHLAVGPNPSDLLANALPHTPNPGKHRIHVRSSQSRSGEIGKVNRMAGEYRLHISFDTFRALDLADYYGKLTGGAYTFTTAALRDLWGFTTNRPTNSHPTTLLPPCATSAAPNP